MKYLVNLLLLLACGGANQKEVVPLIGRLSIMQHKEQPNLVYISYLRHDDKIVIADGQIINPEIWRQAKVQWRNLNRDNSKTLLQSNKSEDQAEFIVSDLYKGEYWLDGHKEKGAYLLEAEVFFDQVAADEGGHEQPAGLEMQQETEEKEPESKEASEKEKPETTEQNNKQIVTDKAIAQRFVSWDNKAAYTKVSRVSGSIENSKRQEILILFVDGYTGELYFSWSNRETQKYLLEVPRYRHYLVYLFGDKLFLDAGQVYSAQQKNEKNYRIEPFEQSSEFGFTLGVGEFSPPTPLLKKNIEVEINLAHYSPSKSIAWLIFQRQASLLYFKIMNTSVEKNILEFYLPEDHIFVNSIISIHNHETIRPVKKIITVAAYKESLKKLHHKISTKIFLDIDNDGLADSSADLDRDNDGIVDSEEEEFGRG